MHGLIVSLVLGAVLAATLVAKRLRVLAEVLDARSLPDVLAGRFESEWTRALTAIAILVGVLGYLATQVLALSKVLQVLLALQALRVLQAKRTIKVTTKSIASYIMSPVSPKGSSVPPGGPERLSMWLLPKILPEEMTR